MSDVSAKRHMIPLILSLIFLSLARPVKLQVAIIHGTIEEIYFRRNNTNQVIDNKLYTRKQNLLPEHGDRNLTNASNLPQSIMYSTTPTNFTETLYLTMPEGISALNSCSAENIQFSEENINLGISSMRSKDWIDGVTLFFRILCRNNFTITTAEAVNVRKLHFQTPIIVDPLSTVLVKSAYVYMEKFPLELDIRVRIYGYISPEKDTKLTVQEIINDLKANKIKYYKEEIQDPQNLVVHLKANVTATFQFSTTYEVKKI